ncbi:response regulator [Hydrogenophaga sp.]|jgi:two-component system probable response regulator PhcQ|uniref:response regulator n=1 Tax=Hydrogenophaga sp. TaxID=1904254 RepID=UPI003F6EC8F6
MKPVKILYVDDEAMALKYFERLVSPLAPVITAGSVEEGRVMLKAHGAEVAVLVCDQRMPGEHGNELLRHAREYYPGVVRMLTTAYSDIGDAVEAINAGEIYRYINKPWEIESLRADLKNALDLAQLRSERDGLMRDKLLAQQSQLRSNRLAALLMLCAAVQPDGHEQALYRYAQAALLTGVEEPTVDWHRWHHADLMQAEAQRGAAIAAHLHHWLKEFGPRIEGAAALPVLAHALGGELQPEGVKLPDALALTGLLSSPVGEQPSAVSCAWLAWLLWQEGLAELQKATDGGWLVRSASAATPRADWLADLMERLSPPAA